MLVNISALRHYIEIGVSFLEHGAKPFLVKAAMLQCGINWK